MAFQPGSIPVNSATAGSDPARSVPAGSTPINAIPDGSVPARSVPAGSVHANAAPASSAPAGLTPAQSAPAVALPAGPVSARPVPLGSVPSGAVPPGDAIGQTTSEDPIVIHEDHHEPVPVPAEVAEDAPIYQNEAAAVLAAQPTQGKQEDVPVITVEENDPRATETSAIYRSPGPPHAPINSGLVDTIHPPGNDGVQLVEGIDNRDLYALLRMFNTQINRVLSPAQNLPPTEPDLRMSNLPNIPYRSDTLKSNFQRVAATVGPSTKRGFRELQRLRDWDKETGRTATYCVSYFVAWFFGYAVLAMSVFFTVLMCFPQTRRYLFPEIQPPPGKPKSATDPTNQKGDESLIAPKHPGQQRTKVEQAEEQGFETRAMIEAYAQAIIVGGGHEKGDPTKQGAVGDDNLVHDEKGNVIGKHVDGDDPLADIHGTSVKVGGENVVAKPGKEKEATNQAVEKKRDQTIMKMAKATETGLGTIADTVEILYNSVSPPIPYPDSHSRFKLAAAFVLLPGLLLTFVPAALFGRVTTFLIGEMFWGWPINMRVIRYLMNLVPNWPELLDLRNSILSGCPTNAQLTLHLLRVSEDLKTPLPPPPENKDIKSAKKTLQDTSPANPSGAEVAAEKRQIEDSSNPVEKVAEKTKAKSKHHLSNAFKKLSKKLAGVHGDVAVDGRTKPINSKLEDKLIDKKFGKDSPDAYGCKLDGKGGHLIIDEDSGRLGWVRVRDQRAEGAWDIASIVELRKDNVAVPRLALGLLGGAEVDSLGLTIRFAGDEEEYHFQSLERREQLFNRLIALGPQRWEIL